MRGLRPRQQDVERDRAKIIDGMRLVACIAVPLGRLQTTWTLIPDAPKQLSALAK